MIDYLKFVKGNSMTPIISSLLDTDLYIWTMANAVFQKYPNVNVKYKFSCRNKDTNLLPIKEKLIEQINLWKNINLSPQEYTYLRSLNLFSEEFLDYMVNFTLNSDIVEIKEIDGKLDIEITGKWIDAIWIEVPLLATINELYFIYKNKEIDELDLISAGVDSLTQKMDYIEKFEGFKFIEFGTRRRYSKEWQEYVFTYMKANLPDHLIGTSNVLLAMESGMPPIGTMAHCWISAHLGLVNDIKDAQKEAFKAWQEVYGQKLGIALCDTFTTKAFIQDFADVDSFNFSGIRIDSGDEMKVSDLILDHWKNIGINPQDKTIVYSNGLNFARAIEIWNKYKDKSKILFGLGTWLTSDMGINHKPLNVVVKLIECNEKDCVKLSDDPGKYMGNPELIKKIIENYKL